MINKKEIKLLKSGELDFIPMTDGYMLRVSEQGQIFITRGGKKRYFLSDRFAYSLCHGYRDEDQIKIIVNIITRLEALTKRVNKKSVTYETLKELLDDIRRTL